MEIFNDMFSCIDDVIREFAISPDDISGAEIIYAEYVPGDYCGDAWVVFRKDGELYEVNSSHCSCNGLEGTWEPTLTSVKAILMRPRLSDEMRNYLSEFDT